MRKFKQALNELMEGNPDGMDFICAMEFNKYAKMMFYQYKGFPITCNRKVPKGKMFFINYQVTYNEQPI